MIKVRELTGEDLDFWVAKALGYKSPDYIPWNMLGDWYAGEGDGGYKEWSPSTEWHQGGPIIDELIKTGFGITPEGNQFSCSNHDGECMPFDRNKECEDVISAYGETVLIAAMRCFVISKLGKQV